MAYIERIEGMGNGSMLDGMLDAISSGYIESEIAQASYRYQQRVESGDYTVVGVNDEYRDEAASAGSLELFEFDYAEEERQIERLTAVRKGRSEAAATAGLKSIVKDARADRNLLPAILSAVADGVTEGEIMGALRDEWGEYVDPGVF